MKTEANAQADSSLGIARRKDLLGRFTWEPSLVVRHLPACSCGCPHPLAHQPPLANAAFCPGCGAAAISPPSEVVLAVLMNSPALRLGGVFLRIAKALLSLRRKLNGHD